MVADLLRHLLVLTNSLQLVVSEGTAIKLKSKGERSGLEHLGWLQVVDLGHALNFSDLHVVALVELMSLIFVDCDNSLLALFDVRNHKLVSILTISICNDVSFAKVRESKAVSTKASS